MKFPTSAGLFHAACDIHAILSDDLFEPKRRAVCRDSSRMNTARIAIVALAWIASVVLVSAQKIHPSLIRNHPAIGYAG